METCFQKLKLIAKKVSIIESVSISLVKSTYVLPVNSGRWKGSGGSIYQKKKWNGQPEDRSVTISCISLQISSRKMGKSQMEFGH